MAAHSVLLVISGSIAAYKSLELIRRLRERGDRVNVILTRGGAQFITPLAVSSLTEQPTYTDLFSLKDEVEMGHIRLVREADMVLVAPASADIIAKLAHGLADDLATTALLAADVPIIIAPAMNVKMWEHPATQANIARLKARGVRVIEGAAGDMACGEVGSGRMAEPNDIAAFVHHAPAPLAGRHAIVTAGPTQEAIDPVRYISNHSSGKQGYALADALAKAGATVTLISGPTSLATPAGVTRIDVKSADEMLAACEHALPADIAICSAAVADWKLADAATQKIKKSDRAPALSFVETVDILHRLSHHTHRPKLVIGFAAETEKLQEYAQAKLARKGCDWIIANDVSGGCVFGQDDNEVSLITAKEVQPFPRMSKQAVAREIVKQIMTTMEK